MGFFLCHCKSIQTQCYTKLTPYVEKKTVLNLKTQTKNWLVGFCTKWSLYVQNDSSDWQSLRTKTISNKDHFVQGWPFRTKAKGVTSNKDFLYEVVPKYLHTFSYKDHFVQRRPYKNPRVNFVFEFFWSSTVFLYSNIRR